LSKKRIPKNKSNNLQKQKYLKTYLIQKNYTLKDLKCEVILIICDMLIDNYINAEDKGKNEKLVEELTVTEKKLVYTNMKNLQEDIQKNILTIDKIQYIINNQQKDNQGLMKAKLLDSTYYFYNLCATKLKSSIISRTKDEDNLKWIPDLIVISLIQDMVENGYSFNKFEFIQNYDLNRLFNVYMKTNTLLKQKDNISLFLKEKTIISIMENVSYEIVEELINSKYK
tara:strand:+ start:2892 stop:3572 length:681 start_codon:yes stop_codon:yes gene_type:complete